MFREWGLLPLVDDNVSTCPRVCSLLVQVEFLTIYWKMSYIIICFTHIMLNMSWVTILLLDTTQHLPICTVFHIPGRCFWTCRCLWHEFLNTNKWGYSARLFSKTIRCKLSQMFPINVESYVGVLNKYIPRCLMSVFRIFFVAFTFCVSYWLHQRNMSPHYQSIGHTRLVFWMESLEHSLRADSTAGVSLVFCLSICHPERKHPNW